MIHLKPPGTFFGRGVVYSYLETPLKARTLTQEAKHAYEKYLHHYHFFSRLGKARACDVVKYCLLRYSAGGIAFIKQGSTPDGVYIMFDGIAEVIVQRKVSNNAKDPNDKSKDKKISIAAEKDAHEKHGMIKRSALNAHEKVHLSDLMDGEYEDEAVAELKEGSVFGEMGLLSEGIKRSATVRCLGDWEAVALFLPKDNYNNLVNLMDKAEKAKSHVCLSRSGICVALNWRQAELASCCKYLTPMKIRSDEDIPIMDKAEARGQVLQLNIDAASSGNGKTCVVTCGDIICKGAALPYAQAKEEAKKLYRRGRYTAIIMVLLFSMNQPTVRQSLPEQLKIGLTSYVSMGASQRREAAEANFSTLAASQLIPSSSSMRSLYSSSVRTNTARNPNSPMLLPKMNSLPRVTDGLRGQDYTHTKETRRKRDQKARAEKVHSRTLIDHLCSKQQGRLFLFHRFHCYSGKQQ